MVQISVTDLIRDKYDLVAWMFCTDAYGTDITSVASAAAGMNKINQENLRSILF